MLHDDFRAQRIFSRWRVRPSFGESATTYFASLVADSEDCSPFLFATRAGLLSGANPSERVLEALLRLPLTLEEKEGLVRWTPLRSQAEQAWTICGNVIAGRRFGATDRNCPVCIKEASYHRVWWDCQGFTTCPIHDTPLTTFNRAELKDQMLFACHGVTKTKITSAPVLSAKGQDSYEGYLLARFGAVHSVGGRPLLDDQPLDLVIKTVQMIGRLLSNRRSQKRTPPLHAATMSVGFDALNGDERTLEEHLNHWLVSNLSPHKLRRASLDHFGYLRQMQLRESTLKSTVLAAMLNASARHGFLVPRLRTKPGVEVPMHKMGLARQTSLSRYGLDNLLPLCWPDMPDAETVKEVPYEVAERVRTVVADLVPLSRAATLLGCSPRKARAVAKVFTLDGRLVSVATKPDGKNQLNFIKAELDLMTGVLDALPPPPTVMRTVGLRRYAMHHELGESRVMADVLAGRIEAFSGSKFGLDKVLFRRPPKAGRGGKPAGVGRTHVPEGAMLGCEFTAITGVNATTMRELLNQGFIKSFGDKRGLLDRAVALAFHQRYVSPVRYMMGRGLIAIEAIWAVKKLNLPMAFAHKTLKPYFAERKDLEARIGPLYRPTEKMMERWRSLIRLGGEHCPSFIVPEVPGDGITYVYTSSRKFSFRVNFAEDGLLLKASFAPDATRMWKIYQEHTGIFREILQSFKWTTEGDVVTASVLITDKPETERATKEIGELATYFRYKMP